jgi:hypothetical protein
MASGVCLRGVRYVPGKGDNGKWTNSLQINYGRFTAGIDYRPLTEKLGPLASVRLLDESKWLPTAMIGTGPDLFGETYSQAYFGVLSKKVTEPAGIKLSPMLGVGYIQELEDWKFIGGGNIRWKDYSVMLYHNGFNPHLVASVDFLKHHTLSFVYWGLELPGASYTIKF